MTHDLSIGYTASRQAQRVVAANVNVTLHAGELVCLLGPNGAGKSTLLRTLAGMQPALNGQVLLAGSALEQLSLRDVAQRLSIVLTEQVDVGNLSAHALVALGRHPHTNWIGQLTEHDANVVRWALDATGATPLAERQLHELSDGERQRVLIARALAQEPAVLVLDEPTAFLDLPRRVDMMRLLRTLARTTQCAVLLSTHDLDLALRSADRLWLMGAGGDLHIGAPEDLVLSGAFEAVFRGEGVQFDVHSGTFRVTAPDRANVLLRGDGLVATWTARALERSGFRVVVQGAALAQVDALADDPSCWHVQAGNDQATCISLYEVVGWLEALVQSREE